VKASTSWTSVAGLLLSVSALTVPGVAQITRRIPPPADAHRFMVLPLRSTDQGLGTEAANSLRSRLGQDYNSHELWVIPWDDMCATLEASGFPCTQVPDRTTARLLASQLRADEYLEGTASKTDRGFKFDVRLVLTRDNTWVQPLPPAEGERMLDVSTAISRAIGAAMKQRPDEKRCESALRDQKPNDAISAGRAAINAYPQATWARDCLAQAYLDTKQPDSTIALTAQVLQIDARNKPALVLRARTYTDMGNKDSSLANWTRLVSSYPTDARLVDEAVRVIASSDKPATALPIIDQALKETPGDPSLLRLKWLLELAARQYKAADTVGRQMVAADTSMADTLYYMRMGAAAASDSQPQIAAQYLAQGTKKFPQNPSLWSTYSATLRSAGQLQPALDAVKHALQLNPKVEHGWYRKALLEQDLNMADSASASLKAAMANGEDKANIAQLLLVQANRAVKHADTTKALADYQTALNMLVHADSLAPNETIYFLEGYSAYQVGAALLKENAQKKTCENAKAAEDAFVIAQVAMPKGGKVDPKSTAAILGAVQQYSPYVDQQKKAFCK
jgi:tetratricopeptide (TPR) repeat protein